MISVVAIQPRQVSAFFLDLLLPNVLQGGHTRKNLDSLDHPALEPTHQLQLQGPSNPIWCRLPQYSLE
jgi:hypothetical protein